MNRIIIAAALAASSATALADEWTGTDKNLHFVVGTMAGAFVTAGTGNELHGLAAAAALGLAKEIYDEKRYGGASGKDFVITVLGGLVGAKFAGWAIEPNRVTYTIKF
jgi:uncharacterized protein YfiM (DUF2279 family)